jgi:transcriptional regulator with XRE-family HTH domain
MSAAMPRPPEIEQFADKLRLTLDRLSLSRVQLAQYAGVDKSVAARWASGRVRPGEQSIVRLTELVRRHISNFSRAEWNLPLTEFAARLGLPLRPMPETPALISSALDARAQDIIARAAQRYAGLWLLTHSSFTGLRRIYAFVAHLRPQCSSLSLEIADPHYRARGTAVVGEGKLCLLAEATTHAHWPCFFIYNGVQLWRALVLDGILLSWGRDVSRAPIAMRTIGFRLAPFEPDPEAASRRFDVALAILGQYFEDDRLQRALPEWVADQLLEMPRDPSCGALRVPMEHSQAIDETTLSMSEPPDGPRRVALEVVQGLFRQAVISG